MQILAFDFGTQYIGIAVGQTITGTSSPLVILNVKEESKNLWKTIENLLSEWKPEIVLVGKPLNMDGTDSHFMKEVDKFVKKLSRISKAPCELVDERLTSFEAKQLVSGKDKLNRLDDLAAKIFLDNWMENNVNPS